RACPAIWRTSDGRYLLWFHNNAVGTWEPGTRNPAWIAGGVEVDGDIHWSQPEVLLYDQNPKVRMSYPDLIEQDGRFWISETQKDVARVHEIDGTLLEAMWKQRTARDVASTKLLVESRVGRGAQPMPRLSPLGAGGGLSIDLRVRVDSLDVGQVLLDWRNDEG